MHPRSTFYKPKPVELTMVMLTPPHCKNNQDLCGESNSEWNTWFPVDGTTREAYGGFRRCSRARKCGSLGLALRP